VLPGLPPLPKNAQFVPPANLDVMTHVLGGYDVSGKPINHDQLPAAVASLQNQRDALAKKSATPYQLQTVDNLLSIYKSNLDALDTHAASVTQKNEQAKKQGEIAAQLSPEGTQLDARNQANAITKQDNAAGNKNATQVASSPMKDSLGVTITPPAGGQKEILKRQDSFKKDADNLAKTEGTFNQFQSVLNDVNSGKDLTGAQSVVALFNAIGISAEPLQGKGFRINSNTVEEHANAIGLPEQATRKFEGLKNGEVITPQQVRDYATIAMQSRHDAYVNKINEARNAGLDPSFLLPRGNGRAIDPNTVSIFLDAANGNKQSARSAAQNSGWSF
jgi:hypothetical protein